MSLLLGLTGKAGSGKDTACDFIREILPMHSVSSMAFADPLKLGASTLFGVDIENFYHNKQAVDKRWGMSYREMLQKLGTEFARDMINRDFWLKRADYTYDGLMIGQPDVIIVTDVRFDNEADWVIEKGGDILEIIRPDTTLTETEQQHASEQDINETLVKYKILNNGTLPELKNGLAELILDITI